MIRATLYFKVKDGRVAEFERAWRAVAEEVRRTPGHLRQALLRDPEDASSVVITSDWESLAAFRRFERSPEQDALTAPLRALREAARMSVQEIVAHYDGGPH